MHGIILAEVPACKYIFIRIQCNIPDHYIISEVHNSFPSEQRLRFIFAFKNVPM